jgi:serine/threonine-protein kinase HipA
MTMPENHYGVWLYERRIGTLHQRGDYTWLTFLEDYRHDPARPALGVVFEQSPELRHAAASRLPPWFSNLLPEGILRDWIAADRGVSPEREMELLAQVGHDLPGAVRVMPVDDAADDAEWTEVVPRPGVDASSHEWRFSLAGVGLKFSMLKKDDRLTLPAFGEGGDWIVKLPDRQFRGVPRNEYTMMRLAKSAGVDVPDVRLLHRDELEGLPVYAWPNREEWAYAVERFDRGKDRTAVHIEDLAQVRNVWPDRKYQGNYETVASLLYRGHDVAALREFARRLAFIILISNGDAHLKNWSLIYRDARVPTIAPAYDLVATALHREDTHGFEQLGLRFGGTMTFDRIRLTMFTRLEQRLGVPGAGLADVAADVIQRVREHWPRHADELGDDPALRDAVSASIAAHRVSLLTASRPA